MSASKVQSQSELLHFLMPDAGWTFVLLVPLLFLPPLFYIQPGTSAPSLFKSTYKQFEGLKAIWPLLQPSSASDAGQTNLLLAAAVLCIIAVRAINVAFPLLYHQLLDRLSASSSDSSSLSSEIFIQKEASHHFPWREIAGVVLLGHVLRYLLYFVQVSVTRRFENLIEARVTLAVYNKIMSLSADYHDSKDSTEIWNTMRESASAIVSLVSAICFEVVPNLLDLTLGIMAFSSVCGLQLAGVMMAVLAAYLVLMVRESVKSEADSKTREKWRQGSRRRDKVSSDTIPNWWTVMLFGRLNYEKHRYNKATDYWRAMDSEYYETQCFAYSIKYLVVAPCVLLLYLLVSRDIWHGDRTPGDLVMLVQLWDRLTEPVENLWRWRRRTFLKDSEQAVEVLRQEPSVKEAKEATDFQLSKGSIHFQGVSLTYKESTQPAVQDITFSIEGRKTTAIVGRSGGGKSTILKLLMRSYDGTGSITIDGQDIKSIRKESLIQQIGIVPQNIGVFNFSILDNLRYAKSSATLEECHEACRAVLLHEKITSFKHGYDEIIGEGGSKLSGGELQRLAIARVLLRDPEIVLLDEASSNLDSETEAQIQDHLRKWAVNRTVVIVAHRLASIAHADLIIAIKDGRIVEQGSHQQLLAKKGYFWELWEKQKLA